MATFIDRVLSERRTLRQALADIRREYEKIGDPDLVDMIRHAEAEVHDEHCRRLPEPAARAEGAARIDPFRLLPVGLGWCHGPIIPLAPGPDKRDPTT